MAGSKINELNRAMREAVAALRDSAEEEPNVDIEMRVLAFETGARWMTSGAVPLSSFEWTDLLAGGTTDLGAAMRALAAELSPANIPDRSLPPVVVLVSDGQPTDDYHAGLRALMDEPWGRKAVRVAIAIGDDVDLDVLRLFIDNPQIEPLTARNPRALAMYLKWASTQVTKSAILGSEHVQLADIPAPMAPDDSGNVW